MNTMAITDELFQSEYEAVLIRYKQKPHDRILWHLFDSVITVTNELVPPSANDDKPAQIFYFTKVQDKFLNYVKANVIATWMRQVDESVGWEESFLTHPVAGSRVGMVQMRIIPSGMAMTMAETDQAITMGLNPIKLYPGNGGVCLWGTEIFRNGKLIRNNAHEVATGKATVPHYACLKAVLPQLSITFS